MNKYLPESLKDLEHRGKIVRVGWQVGNSAPVDRLDYIKEVSRLELEETAGSEDSAEGYPSVEPDFDYVVCKGFAAEIVSREMGGVTVGKVINAGEDIYFKSEGSSMLSVRMAMGSALELYFGRPIV